MAEEDRKRNFKKYPKKTLINIILALEDYIDFLEKDLM